MAGTEDDSSPTDHRPRGPQERVEAATADPAEESKARRTADRSAARSHVARKTRGGVRHGRNNEQRVQCRVCHRWVNQCERAQAQHRASKFCLTWRFYQKGFKWHEAERMSEEAAQDEAFLKRLDEDPLPEPARPARGAVVSQKARPRSPDRSPLRERARTLHAPRRGEDFHRSKRSRSRTPRARTPRRDRDSRPDRSAEQLGRRERSAKSSREPSRRRDRSARPTARRGPGRESTPAVTREQRSASEEYYSEESRTSPARKPLKAKKETAVGAKKTSSSRPAAESKGTSSKERAPVRPPAAAKGKTAEKTKTASSKTAPVEESEYEYYSQSDDQVVQKPTASKPAAPAAKAAGKNTAAPQPAAVKAEPSSGLSADARTAFVNQLLATAIEKGLKH